MKLAKLRSVTKPLPLGELTEEQVKELQKVLSLLGYPVGDINGLIGPKTRNAWAEFKTDVSKGNSNLIGRESIETLQNNLYELDSNQDRDFSTREKTIESITQECKSQGFLATQIAYVLATTQWETAHTFEPVREEFLKNEEWRKNNLRYYPYYGRGYVQLTWERNYQRYSDILDMDFVKEPDLVMNPVIASFILIHGFKVGVFTGRKISDYINESRSDFINARRCINGLDKANEIATIAKTYLESLRDG